MLAPEVLVPLALELHRAVERYPTPSGGPPSSPLVADEPLIEAWAAEVAELAGVTDPVLARAGLLAVRWLGWYRADVARQVAACDALGIDRAALVTELRAALRPLISELDELLGEAQRRRGLVEPVDQERRLERLQRFANAQRGRRVHHVIAELVMRRPVPTGPEHQSIERWGAEQGRLRERALSGDRTEVPWGVVGAALQLPAPRSAGRRPWLWPWEPSEPARMFGEEVAPLPVVYPPDWSVEWTDRHGRADQLVPGGVLVIAAEEVEPAMSAAVHRAPPRSVLEEPPSRGRRRGHLEVVPEPAAPVVVEHRATPANKASGSGVFEPGEDPLGA